MSEQQKEYFPIDDYQSMYYWIIKYFFKSEYQEMGADVVEKRYDPAITEETADEMAYSGSYNDGTVLFDYENIAYAIWDAIESGKYFGPIIDKSCEEKSPDPSRPFLRHHCQIYIPLKDGNKV